MTIRSLKPGDTLRSGWIDQLVAEVNRLRGEVDALLGVNPGGIGDAETGQGAGYANLGGAGGGGSMPTSITFAESTRGYVTRSAVDDNGDTFTYQVATSIVMTASNGGTNYSWTFRYNAPT